MKKIIIVLFSITLIYVLYSGEEQILIPEESLRFRVIANSDEQKDQQLKLEVKESVEAEINKLMVQANNIKEARELIQKTVEHKIKDVFGSSNKA